VRLQKLDSGDRLAEVVLVPPAQEDDTTADLSTDPATSEPATNEPATSEPASDETGSSAQA
jgi:hypothetical protein